jgi:hypothetical protein
MNNIHIYSMDEGKLMGEYKSTLKALEAIEQGAVPGLHMGHKYIVCEVHKVATPKLDFIDITSETLNRTTDSTVAPTIPAPKKVSAPVDSKDAGSHFESPDSTLETQTTLQGSPASIPEDDYLLPDIEDMNQGIDLGG